MRPFLAALVLLALAGCIPTEPHRLSIQAEADPPTAAVGDTVKLHVNVQATRLTEIEIEYGDGVIEEKFFPQVNWVQWTFAHVYRQSGSYRVQATANDATVGSAATWITVTIQ